MKQSSQTIHYSLIQRAVIREFYCAAHCLNKGNLICNSCRVSLCLVDRANKKSPNKNTETMGRGGSDWISRCMLLLESPVLNGDFVESLLEEDLLHFKRVDTDINKVDSL